MRGGEEVRMGGGSGYREAIYSKKGWGAICPPMLQHCPRDRSGRACGVFLPCLTLSNPNASIPQLSPPRMAAEGVAQLRHAAQRTCAWHGDL